MVSAQILKIKLYYIGITKAAEIFLCGFCGIRRSAKGKKTKPTSIYREPIAENLPINNKPKLISYAELIP